MDEKLEGLPEPVREALDEVTRCAEAMRVGYSGAPATIRAELIRLARENAELRANADDYRDAISEAIGRTERAESALAELRAKVESAPWAEVSNLTGNGWSFREWRDMPDEWATGVQVRLLVEEKA